MTATQDETIVDLQRANAELQRERDAALAREAALVEVQRVIAGSPGDSQQVLDLIAQHAMKLCEVPAVGVALFDGTTLHLAAQIGFDTAYAEDYAAQFPRRAARDTAMGRAILSQCVVQIENADADPEYGIARPSGAWSALAVPLMRNGSPLGVISVGRPVTGVYPNSQATLLQSFADQAVIAIHNAETHRALQTRTGDLQESLEYQTATSEVLKVISRSTFDLQPVFQTVADTAVRLCHADQAGIYLDENGEYRWASGCSQLPEYERIEREARIRPGTGTLVGRVALEGRPVQILDAWTDTEYEAKEDARVGAIHTLLGIPLLRDGSPIGVIGLGRQKIEPFTERQIELVGTFAAQAVIAIENARLITEQREALEQQIATAEVLQVINASPGNLGPVFDTVLESALRLCAASFGALLAYDGEHIERVALLGVPPAFAEWSRRNPLTKQAALISRGIETGKPIQAADVVTDALMATSSSVRDAIVELGGVRALLQVPLLKDGAVVGFIVVFRREPGAFPVNQIALLENFAAQSVIAMENARLLGELQERTAALAARNSEYGERIEQQSATIDVLKAMSASPGDAQPVFELIARRALDFCGADGARLVEFDGRLQHLRALARADGIETEADQVLRRMYPAPPDQDSFSGRVILQRAIVHTWDEAPSPSVFRGRYAGSVVGIPLLRHDRVAGAIVLSRSQPGGFAETQIELMQTFAEQAVIAIGSAETYRELQARTAALAARNSEYGERIEQQSATIDVLKAMSDSPDDTQPVFDLIARRAAELCESRSGLWEFDGTLMHARAHHGVDSERASAFFRLFPLRPDHGTAAGRAILGRRVVHIKDVAVDPEMSQAARDLGGSAIAAIPLLRDGQPMGVIALNGSPPGGFSDSQIALLQTFAEQAVIAIGSVNTYRELQTRTAELTRSVAELRALEEVLRAVNSSLDLDIVLATIISRAVQLSQADEGTIYEFDETEEVFVPKAAFGMTAERVEWLRERKVRLGETHLGRSAVLRAPVQIDDVQQDPTMADVRGFLRGIHAVLAVPLLREDALVGGLVIRRRTGGGFAPTIPTLLQTFAGQSVLAIENARLFQEARRARAAAEITLDDLRRAQDQLIQVEKMASLGQLTAGIAHEIKNPLNFVNNFADLSVDLLDELNAAVAPDKLAAAADQRAEIDDLTTTLKGNLEKIVQHGRRADSTVKNMLLHSRSGPSEHRSIQLNATVEEALNLAYHGARAETPGFNITMKKDLDPAAGMVDLYPQEFIRVMLNLINNGFYAARKRANQGAEPGFEPTLWLTTRNLGEQVEIRVRDNGTGISEAVRDKIFEPFFTTKPAGEGTGLGLSLSYDIVVKQHGGRLTVDSRIDAFTEFQIILPRAMAATDGGQA